MCVLSGHGGGGLEAQAFMWSPLTPQLGPHCCLAPGSLPSLLPHPQWGGARQDLMWVEARLPTQPLLAWVGTGHGFPAVFGWRRAVSVYKFSVLLGCLSPGPSPETAGFCGHVFVPMSVSGLLASSAPHLESRGKKKT